MLILQAFFVNADSQIRTQYGLVIVPLQGPTVIQSHLISGIVLRLPKVISLSEKLQTVCKGSPKLVMIFASLAGDQQGGWHYLLSTVQEYRYIINLL